MSQITGASAKDYLSSTLRELCEHIGPRPTGTGANQRAVELCDAAFRRLGYDTERQEFDCMDWRNDGAALTVNGVEVAAEAAEYTLPCDVSGELVCCDTIEGLRNAAVTGKICVLHGALCAEPLMPKSMVFWNPDEHREIIRLLETGKPLAVVTVSFLPDVAVPVIQDGDFEIPCAAVRGGALEALVSGQRARLTIRAERRASKGANLIASSGQKGGRVVFSAHIDTKPNTPGALDNAGGVAVLLGLAAALKEEGRGVPVEFALFNGEDYYSTPGETAYMGSCLQEPGRYRFAFNIDGVGLGDSMTSLSFYACPDDMKKTVLSCAGGGFEEIEPWPMGDHMLYAHSGVPTAAITASGIFGLVGSVLHTPGDNLGMIAPDKLEEVVRFLVNFIKKTE